MEIMQIALEMQKAIVALGKEGGKSVALIESKARTMADYDKACGVAEAARKASGMAVTLIKAQAKGDTSELLYAKIIAEESLKAHYSRMSQIEAQLNGLQSMNRHLKEL